MKSHDQHLREQDERQALRVCSEVGCSQRATMSHGTSQNDCTWLCRFHFWNPSQVMRPGDIQPPEQSWRERAIAEWRDSLSAEQLDYLERRPGERRSDYAGRILAGMRRLAERATIQALPYEKGRSLSGD